VDRGTSIGQRASLEATWAGVLGTTRCGLIGKRWHKVFAQHEFWGRAHLDPRGVYRGDGEEVQETEGVERGDGSGPKRGTMAKQRDRDVRGSSDCDW